jgi:hypothetical protein
MSNSKNPKKRKEQKQIEVTKEPDWGMLALWYALSLRGFRDRRKARGVKIPYRVLSDTDYGEVFYKCGMPPRLPNELNQWAEDLIAAYRRLLP